MVKKILANLQIKEENEELQRAIAKEIEDEDNKDLKELLNERERAEND